MRHVTLPEPDPSILEQTLRYVGPVCDRYFRSEVRHLERVPSGGTLLIGNHDGGLLPVDGLCFGVGWHRHFKSRRPLRVFMHEIPFHLARPITRWLHGVGIVSARPENFEAMLDRSDAALLYPGAAREAFRPYRQRREVDLGGRMGFVRRALRRDIPITPVASAGGHETFFVLFRNGWLARATGVYKYFRADAWPLAMGLPWGLWFGPMWPYLPLPSKIVVEVQQPIDLRARLSTQFGRPVHEEDADDPEVVRAGFELVRRAMHDGVGRLYDERRFPVIG